MEVHSRCDGQLASIIARILIGLTENVDKLQKQLKKVEEEISAHSCTQQDKYAQLQAEFDKFKQANNLDYYFEKNLNKETRKQTVENVNQLLAENSAWYDEHENTKLNFDDIQESNAYENLQKQMRWLTEMEKTLYIPQNVGNIAI